MYIFYSKNATQTERGRLGAHVYSNVVIGDSIVNNLFRFRANQHVLEEEFGESYINCGVGRDRVSNVFWRIGYHKYLPMICDTIIIQVGTNDVAKCCNKADDIACGIMQVVDALFKN